MISLVILPVSIFSAVQKLLGVCCDSRGKCCHRQQNIMLWLLHGVSWLAVNPALFLRQIPFLEKHVPLFTFVSPPEWGDTGSYGVLHGACCH